MSASTVEAWHPTHGYCFEIIKGRQNFTAEWDGTFLVHSEHAYPSCYVKLKKGQRMLVGEYGYISEMG